MSECIGEIYLGFNSYYDDISAGVHFDHVSDYFSANFCFVYLMRFASGDVDSDDAQVTFKLITKN
jgi:hypothetical protein